MIYLDNHLDNNNNDKLHEIFITLQGMENISVDYETTGTNPYTNKPILLAIGNKDYKVVIDVRQYDKTLITKLFNTLKHKLFIAHNAKFEYEFTKVHYGVELRNIYCTMVASQIIYNGWDFGHGLDEVLKRHFDITIDKSLQRSFINFPDNNSFSPEQINYSSTDIDYLEDLMIRQAKFIDKYNLNYLIHMEMTFLPCLADMELRGVIIDTVKWKQYLIEINNELQKAIKSTKDYLYSLSKLYPHLTSTFFKKNKDKNQIVFYQYSLFDPPPKDLDEVCIDTLNLDSSTQIKLIFDRLGYKVSSTGKDALNKLRKTLPEGDKIIPFVKGLLTIRKYKKLLSTYGKKFLAHINPVTGKLHSEYSQAFTDTGRLSSANVNLQNLPRDNRIRNCFVSLPGYVIDSIDLEGQEIKVAASQSQDPVLLQAASDGLDIHSYLAQQSFRIITGDNTLIVSKEIDSKLRTKHKNVLFAIFYGAGANRISEVLDISMDIAYRVLNNIKKALPTLMAYQEKVKARVRDEALVIANDVTNRRRYFDKYVRGLEEAYEVEKAGVNHPIQATSADMVKECIINIDEHLKQFDIPHLGIIMQVHDEILLHRPKDRDDIRDKVVEIMCTTCDKYLTNVKMKAEYKTAEYWNK